jgi:hypothetical protein
LQSTDFKVSGNTIIGLRQADLDCFSVSDLECLDYAISNFGKKSDWPSRKRESHDQAYDESWNKRGKKGSVEIPVEDIVKTLTNSTELIDYLSNSG